MRKVCAVNQEDPDFIFHFRFMYGLKQLCMERGVCLEKIVDFFLLYNKIFSQLNIKMRIFPIDTHKNSLLHLLVKHDNEHLIPYAVFILALNPDYCGKHMTPVHQAIFSRNLNALKILSDYFDLTIPDAYGRSPVVYALEERVRLLKSDNADEKEKLDMIIDFLLDNANQKDKIYFANINPNIIAKILEKPYWVKKISELELEKAG